MQGKRVLIITDPIHLKPGEYGKWRDNWFVCTPRGNTGNVSGHKIEEHEDGSITVSPSILIRTSSDGGKTWIDEWHGYLEKGIWREC